MQLKKILIIITCLFTSFLSNEADAQKLIIDSLENAINKAKGEDKPVIMAELARAMNESDPDKALATALKALSEAKKYDDAGHKSFCYATAGHILMRKEQETKATAYIDSALKCAQNSNDKTFKAYAWLRKGWLELVKGDNQKAIAELLKADLFIQSVPEKRAYSYRSLINHYIASIYAYGSDTLKQHKYAILSLQNARKSTLGDDMQIGYMTVGHSFFSAFERDTTKHSLLDSSMAYYHRSMDYYLHSRDRIFIQSNASATALNIANSYFKYYPVTYRDSAQHFINIALDIARRTNGHEVIANCYGMLSEYALRAKDFKKAEQYLLTGLTELSTASSAADITRSRMVLGLATLAEKSGDSKKALAYYKQYLDYYKKVFDGQKLAIVQRLEEQYHAQQQATEILRLRERADYNSRLNWLYIAIGTVSVVLLGLLLSSYHYKLKAAQKQKQLSEQKTQEAELLIRLQKAEADRLELEKQEAELQISLKEEEGAKLQAQQELLQDRTDWLEKELLAGTLKLEEKNAILSSLKEKSRDADPKVTRQISRMIDQNLRMDKNMSEQQALNLIHPGFFSTLQERAANSLTRLDLKYCAYILMGLDTKEIAGRLGVEPKSIRMARYRLKQKLKLEKDDNLDQFIHSLEKGMMAEQTGIDNEPNKDTPDQ
ncbi:LuxR C-terminal-related transcriptional regulator [Mucilaginibacter roseus]|uniref:LuxR C-terminal-related transcriptional regulator n=1 Tax=Mucilaginibacter roseus TaxID=1528868 RepID=A0ABS8TW89_9SPHI|nr:LuxR C-terminal-related transcriptional regulator [Mucilaginibacter roseus]MCD8739151.1 LuxR C-terminal-related transcriptional regulator [Mucilaginibacter roseus]